MYSNSVIISLYFKILVGVVVAGAMTRQVLVAMMVFISVWVCQLFSFCRQITLHFLYKYILCVC